MLRAARYILAGVVVLAALPSLAVAGEAMKDVFITNTPDDPVPVQGVGTQQISGNVEVSNLPATQRVNGSVQIASPDLRSGGGYAFRGAGGDVFLPDDIVLTDLVLTLISPAPAPTVCEVAFFEDPGAGDLQSVVGFFPTTEDRTEQLHLESGLMPRPGWGIGVNTDCVVQVFWTGFTLP